MPLRFVGLKTTPSSNMFVYVSTMFYTHRSTCCLPCTLHAFEQLQTKIDHLPHNKHVFGWRQSSLDRNVPSCNKTSCEMTICPLSMLQCLCMLVADDNLVKHVTCMDYFQKSLDLNNRGPIFFSVPIRVYTKNWHFGKPIFA